MKTLDNEIVVRRGETFTIDKLIQNKDGSPYVISNKLVNPYFVVTVTNARYEQDKRYKKNYWLDLSELPKFEQTTCINLLDIKNGPDEGASSVYTSFDAITTRELSDTTSEYYIVAGYYKGLDVEIDYADAVFYLDNADGTRDYRYFKLNSGSETVGAMVEYQLRITFPILHTDTKKWVEQSYLYNITLVSGKTTEEYINEIGGEQDELWSQETAEMTLEQKYNRLLEQGIKFFEEFDIGFPIYDFDTYIPILGNTKLTVLSNLHGGI